MSSYEEYVAENEAESVRLALRRVNLKKLKPYSEREISVFIPVLKRLLLKELERAIQEDDDPVRAKVFEAFRTLNSFDFSEVIEAISPVHRVLLSDAVYKAMTPSSRALYRRKIAALAKRNRADEAETANLLLPGLHSKLARVRLSGEPNLPPRIELSGGIPNDGRTLVTVAALLTDKRSGESLCRKLEEYYLANREDNICFCLLADLKEASAETLPQDAEIIQSAVNSANELNLKYGERFYVFTRPRQYVQSDNIWRPWERKRGAILSLCRFLRGLPSNLTLPPYPLAEMTADTLSSPSDTPLSYSESDATEKLSPSERKAVMSLFRSESAAVVKLPMKKPRSDSKSTRVLSRSEIETTDTLPHSFSGDKGQFAFLILLDADTRPGIGSLRELIGTALHPANSPQVDPKRRIVTKGYGILQPRIGVELRAANKSVFAKVFSGNAGTDPYGAPSGDFWQDKFGEGSFNGKGLLNIDAFLACMENRLPENQVLSHDLLEGAYLRVGFVGDVEFTDGFPTSLKSFLTRERRWIRGDWQLLPFLSDPDMSILNKWKMLGNLRRSVLPLRLDWRSLTLMPLRMANAPGAIAAALWRQFVSRKGLLDWTTSAETESAPKPEKKRQNAIIDKNYLPNCAADIWNYFEDYLTVGRGLLPPDNVQFNGTVKVAERTSPTNIGLAILSVIAASDLKIIALERAETLVSVMLDSVEKLTKWRGHLYNWYSTVSLLPSEPKFVSTADSGNLACCLIAAANWNNGKFAERAKAIALAMDFSALYDKERKLFSVGFDCSENELSKSYYDLMCSEARLASFFAIASGQVSAKHWATLSRADLLSWSGTMFEYFMPALLLPHRGGSLLRSALNFCVKEQIRYSEPWGVSESAYSEKNDSGDYKYKAHGVPKLAIDCNVANKAATKVLSPYSAFLALPFIPESAMENLKKLEELGAYGQYGFCEAVDCKTPVQAFMAHHLGMSIVAIDNALNGGIFVRRFTREPFIAAHLGLVDEKPRKRKLFRRKTEKAVLRFTHALEADVTADPNESKYTLKRLNLNLVNALGGKVYAPDGTLLLKDVRIERGKLRFTAALAPEKDYEAHPALHKLQIESERDEHCGSLTLRRRAGGSLPPIELIIGKVRVIRDYNVPDYLAKLFGEGNRKERQDEIIRDFADKSGLWKFGISGDYATLYFDVPDGDTDALTKARWLTREHRELRAVGVRYDLIFGMHDEGEYGKPTRSAMGEAHDGVYFIAAQSPDLPAMLAMVDLEVY
ncbi:MAG: hypothetical protein LBN43_02965 [Oscillospiraceae bacterium]|nr:hypothetical protein [Oscillospiraceae bacterium]